MLNYFLSLLRITPKGWLADPMLAMASVIVADVWQWTPFVVLICLSGLQTIPLEALEAARIDGANKSQELRYLVIPLLRNFLAVAFIFRAMDTIKMFDIIYIMTEGGPGTSTEVLSTYIYRVAFRNMHADQAAAMSYITLLLLSVFAMLFIRQWRNAR
jgi:multiple sugar transport system permease protein